MLRLCCAALAFAPDVPALLGHVHTVQFDGLWEFFHGKTTRPKVMLLPTSDFDAAQPWLQSIALAFNHTDPFKTAFVAYVPPVDSERVAQLFRVETLPALLGCRVSIMWGWRCHLFNPATTLQIMDGDGSDEEKAAPVEEFIHDLLNKTTDRLSDDDARPLPSFGNAPPPRSPGVPLRADYDEKRLKGEL